MSVKLSKKSVSSKSGTKNSGNVSEAGINLKVSCGGLLPMDNKVVHEAIKSVKSVRDYRVNGFIINDSYIEGIDYFEIYCFLSDKWTENTLKEGICGEFKIIDEGWGTKVYSKSFLVEDKRSGRKMCVINCTPRSSILPERGCNVKFDNEVLYYRFFDQLYVDLLLYDLGLEFKSVSRLDIYRDFQRFKSFLPDVLVERFIKEKYLNVSSAKYELIGNIMKMGNDREYLRIGSRCTCRQVCIYNKSLELTVKEDKEYIRKTWDEVGFHRKVDTWRLELRLWHLNRFMFRGMGIAGDEISIREVFDQGIIKRVYEAGLNQLFRFVKNEGKRKNRCEAIELFSDRDYNVRLLKRVYHTDHLWSRKVTVKGLVMDILNTETREHKSRSVEDQIDFVNRYVSDNHMVTWFKEKFLLKLSVKLCTDYCRGGLRNFVFAYFVKNW